MRSDEAGSLASRKTRMFRGAFVRDQTCTMTADRLGARSRDRRANHPIFRSFLIRTFDVVLQTSTVICAKAAPASGRVYTTNMATSSGDLTHSSSSLTSPTRVIVESLRGGDFQVMSLVDGVASVHVGDLASTDSIAYVPEYQKGEIQGTSLRARSVTDRWTNNPMARQHKFQHLRKMPIAGNAPPQ